MKAACIPTVAPAEVIHCKTRFLGLHFCRNRQTDRHTEPPSAVPRSNDAR